MEKSALSYSYRLIIAAVLVGFGWMPIAMAEKFEDIIRNANQGHADSQFSLGEMYYHGHFVLGQFLPKDYAVAVRWFRLAAEQGHAAAQYNLGVRYANGGHGMSRDVVQAYMWFALAAQQENPDAIVARDRIAMSMTPAQIAQAQQLVQNWKPSTGSSQTPDQPKP
ncbi:MAG: sel1 repeat family protein [Magnetococcales bacterium]|nr:sel1 repeat family protein [Magnetococcales bacterium]